jgi:xanthine dehydrogenase accessory factor
MIAAVVERCRTTGATVVTASYGGVTAPPTLYTRGVLPELLAGAPEGRGRVLVRRLGSAVERVELPPWAVADVDLPADLERVQAVAAERGSVPGSVPDDAAPAPVPDNPAAPLPTPVPDDAARRGGSDATDEEVLVRASAWIASGRRVALATVTRTWGSSLRPVGSQLAVADSGEFVGSVSGGCVESDVVREALEVVSRGGPRRLEYGVPDDRAWAVGLPCGGTVEIAVVRAAPEWVNPLRDHVGARRPVVLGIDLVDGVARVMAGGGPVPGGPVPDDRFRAHVEPEELHAAVREALRTGRAASWPGPSGRLFLRPFLPPVRLVIVGAVHVAQALARMAPGVGLDVTVVDPRLAFATAARFPGVRIVAAWPSEAFAQLGVDVRTAVVTLAHDPKIDDPALSFALRAGCFYVGALGSRRSHAARLDRLREQGIGDADLARILGPVGLPIGAVTPGEIATSILAQIVERLRAPAT